MIYERYIWGGFGGVGLKRLFVRFVVGMGWGNGVIRRGGGVNGRVIYERV